MAWNYKSAKEFHGEIVRLVNVRTYKMNNVIQYHLFVQSINDPSKNGIVRTYKKVARQLFPKYDQIYIEYNRGIDGLKFIDPITMKTIEETQSIIDANLIPNV